MHGRSRPQSSLRGWDLRAVGDHAFIITFHCTNTMHNDTTFVNLRQDLLEKIADWLDSRTVKKSEYLSGQEFDRDDDLHIKMADAAMEVYAKSRELVFES